MTIITFFFIQDLQAKAESLIKDYQYHPTLTLDQVKFNNVNEVDDDVLEYNDHYKQDVNLTQSGVHIPIEIYEGCESPWHRRPPFFFPFLLP